MNFIKHSNLSGLHAPFSASSSAWLRYSDDKLLTVFENLKAKEIGTKLHAWAKDTIDLGIKQPRSKKTIYAYVNDAIGFKMDTEVVLYYSNNFLGTADSICFRNNILRIHDLETGKSGKIEDHIEQLEVYAALFCLEYKYKPSAIDIELRLYKQDEVLVHHPDPEKISYIMDTIIHFDELIEKSRLQEV